MTKRDQFANAAWNTLFTGFGVSGGLDEEVPENNITDIETARICSVPCIVSGTRLSGHAGIRPVSTKRAIMVVIILFATPSMAAKAFENFVLSSFDYRILLETRSFRVLRSFLKQLLGYDFAEVRS